jgi:hypothetical protein
MCASYDRAPGSERKALLLATLGLRAFTKAVSRAGKANLAAHGVANSSAKSGPFIPSDSHARSARTNPTLTSGVCTNTQRTQREYGDCHATNAHSVSLTEPFSKCQVFAPYDVGAPLGSNISIQIINFAYRPDVTTSH